MDSGLLIAAVCAGLIVFLLLREVFCWYLKVNKRVSQAAECLALQREMLDELRVLRGLVEESLPEQSPTTKNE